MGEKAKRYEIEENLYAVDSSGPAPEGDRMKRLADRISREVEENFDPDKIGSSGSGNDSNR